MQFRCNSGIHVIGNVCIIQKYLINFALFRLKFADVLRVQPQGPPYMEIFPSFSINLSIFHRFPKPIHNWMVKKGQTFIFDFLQSHIEISANFTRTDKNLVPIDQGKSILFEYQHILAAYPYIPFVFSWNVPSSRFGHLLATCRHFIGCPHFKSESEVRAANEMPAFAHNSLLCCQ